MSRFLRGSHWLLSIATFLVCLILADLALRAFGSSLITHRPHELLFQQQWPKMPWVPRFEENALFDRESFGDLASVLPDTGLRVKRPLRFQTDKHGFRNPPNAADRGIDLILVGDSFAAGDGTTQGEIWSERLRQKNVRVYNLGISGSPWQEYINLMLMLDHLKFHPGTQVVWALFPGNDLDETYHDPMLPAQLPRNSAFAEWRLRFRRFVSLSPIRQMILRALKGRSNTDPPVIVKKLEGVSVLFYKDYLRSMSLTREQVLSYWSYRRLGQVMWAMGHETKKHGLRLTVLIVPSKEEVYEWLLKDKDPWTSDTARSTVAQGMMELCRETGLECFDMKAEFIQRSKELYEREKGLLYWPDDSHWNKDGHRLAAAITEERLGL